MNCEVSYDIFCTRKFNEFSSAFLIMERKERCYSHLFISDVVFFECGVCKRGNCSFLYSIGGRDTDAFGGDIEGNVATN